MKKFRWIGLLTCVYCVTSSTLQAVPFGGSSLGINVPSGLVLPKNRLQVSPFLLAPAASDGLDFSLTGVRASFGLFGYGEIGASFLYSPFSNTQASLDLQFSPLPDGFMGFYPGLGVRNISTERQIGTLYSPFDAVTGSQTVQDDINTNSVYVTVSTQENSLIEATLGWGTGEFRGHGPINQALRGIFGQVTVNLGNLHGIAEMDGRSLHAGASYDISDRTNVAFAILNGENLRQAPRRAGYRPSIAFRFSQAFDIGSRKAPKSLAETKVSEKSLSRVIEELVVAEAEVPLKLRWR